MKRAIGVGFFLAALAVCAVAIYDAQARPAVMPPVAVCSDGTCTMKAEDFKTLQDFHAATVRAYLGLEEREKEYVKAIDEMNRAIASLSSRCGGRRA